MHSFSCVQLLGCISHPCSLGSYIQRELLGDFKLQAGTALSRRNLGEDGRALTNFCGKSAKVPSNAGSFAHLRSNFAELSARFAGMYPANFFHMRSRLATAEYNEDGR